MLILMICFSGRRFSLGFKLHFQNDVSNCSLMILNSSEGESSAVAFSPASLTGRGRKDHLLQH